MKFPQKTPYIDRINKQSNKVMLFKAINNAAVGFPISAILNLVITLPFSNYFIANNLCVWIYPIMLGAPFVVVSVVRQYLIDYFLAVYNINCEPSYLIRKSITLLVRKINQYKDVWCAPYKSPYGILGFLIEIKSKCRTLTQDGSTT